MCRSAASSCPRLPAARTYLSLPCRPAPAGLPIPAGPGREREALGRRRVPQPRCGGRRAPGTGKRSRPCAGNSAAGREEGAASPPAPAGMLLQLPEKALSGLPAAFPLPSARAAGFVCLLLCLDGFNGSVSFRQSGKREEPAAWCSLHLFRGKGIVLLGRENFISIRGCIL